MGLVPICLFAATAMGNDRLNLVVIIADDLGYGETGAQENSGIPTPALDRLAADGVRCTSAYVTSSFCSPSRAGFYTGRYQSRFGYDHNPTGARNLLPDAGLPATESTFVAQMQQHGYRTGLIGKWHLGATLEKHPLRRGFNMFYGFLHEGHFYVPGPPYPNVLTMLRTNRLPAGQLERRDGILYGNYTGTNEPPYNADNPILRGSEEIIEPKYLTDAITDNAVDFIRVHSAEPFALIVSYNAVHSPMQALESDLAKFALIENPQRRIFAGMLSALDRGVGKITTAIHDAGLTEKTLVVFFSDNGGPTQELTSSNAPLRGGKGDLYEGGVRIPMIWSLPGRLPAGRVENRPILTLDIAASGLALAGAPLPETLDGVDALPYLSGENTAALHEQIYWRMQGGKAAFRHGNLKWVRPRADAPAELYDLATDLSETHDLATTRPADLQHLTAAWEQANAAMAPPIMANRQLPVE